MTSLTERLCNWVQIQHLYQPTREGLVGNYVRYHVAHCNHCRVEIQSIEMLGLSIAELDFDVTSTPTDESWARLSAALPPRDVVTFETDPANDVVRTNLVPRAIALTAVVCTGIAFATIYIRGNQQVTPAQPQDIAIKSPAVQLNPIGKPSVITTPDAALMATREQAKAVAPADRDTSDPFLKQGRIAENDAILPPTNVKSPAHSLPSGRKPLVIAANVDSNQTGRESSDSSNTSLDTPSLQPQAASRFAMRTSAAISQSDQQFDAANTSTGGGGFAASPVSYTPSPAMELTESQNRLRSLLQ